MTPDELDDLEYQQRDCQAEYCGKPNWAVKDIAAALRTAWADRDALKAESSERVAALLQLQKLTYENGSRVAALEVSIPRLTAERDARPTPETVAKVREALRQICGEGYGRDDTNYDATVAREALRLLEKP